MNPKINKSNFSKFFLILILTSAFAISCQKKHSHDDASTPARNGLPQPGADGADVEYPTLEVEAHPKETPKIFPLPQMLTNGFPLSEDFELPTSVDLRDLANYPRNAQEGYVAKTIFNELSENSQKYFPAGVSIDVEGPKKDPSTRTNKVFGVEVENQLATDSDYTLGLWALFQTEDKVFALVHIHMRLDGDWQVADGGADGDIIPLKNTQWKMHVSIYDQLIRLEEPQLHIVKFYPVGVGAIDKNGITPMQNGRADSLSVELPEAYLSPSLSMWSRTEPRIYKGKPFLRIVSSLYKNSAGQTPFGFHEAITKTMHRTFISNGCYRMRDKDLYELAAVVKTSTEPGVPVELSKNADLDGGHPMPYEKWYYIIKTAKDDEGHLQALRDKEGYYQMLRISGRWTRPAVEKSPQPVLTAQQGSSEKTP